MEEGIKSLAKTREENIKTINKIYFEEFLPLKKQLKKQSKQAKRSYTQVTKYSWAKNGKPAATDLNKVENEFKNRQSAKKLLYILMKLGYSPNAEDLKPLNFFDECAEYLDAKSKQLDLGFIITKRDLLHSQPGFSGRKPKPIIVDNFIQELWNYKNIREQEYIDTNKSKHTLFKIEGGIDYQVKMSAFNKIMIYLRESKKSEASLTLTKEENAAIHQGRLEKIVTYYKDLLPEIQIIEKEQQDKQIIETSYGIPA